MIKTAAGRLIFSRRGLACPFLRDATLLSHRHRQLGAAISVGCAHFHSHEHHEPEHFKYRGDGLPSIPCEEIQQIVHINERMSKGKLAPMRQPTVPLREVECSVEGHNMEVYQDLKELHDKVLATNWHNTGQLLMDADILEGTLERLKERAQDITDMQVQIMLSKTLEIFDALYKVEDVQDHIFELVEEIKHYPIGASTLESNPQAAKNMEKHVKHLLENYAKLKRDHPRYAVKIQESVGYSLGVLRQCYTFNWPEEHKYFY
ncbi:hypothetical protein BgAZ_206390 [Babesia gibsoni]|uniref:DUF6827 domain-containing protein n=1 Tax=Babesia gibsoni TaxID=33632 RepID=A0AAD8PDS1_BABGI|nr:hypothetical protein BgAZ_206390 [Babesia gibsoni]